MGLNILVKLMDPSRLVWVILEIRLPVRWSSLVRLRKRRLCCGGKREIKATNTCLGDGRRNRGMTKEIEQMGLPVWTFIRTNVCCCFDRSIPILSDYRTRTVAISSGIRESK